MEPTLAEVRRRLQGCPPRLLQPRSPSWRPAGVLVPLLLRPEGLHLVLIRRGLRLAHHQGQIAFPGGCREPQDRDLQQTALREAIEEIALAPEGVEVLGRLDDVWTPTGFVMSAFVAAVPHPQDFRPQDVEVEEILEIPLAHLTREGVYREEVWTRSGQEIPVSFFDLAEVTVWGATGRLLARLLEVGFGWRNPGRPWQPGPLPIP